MITSKKELARKRERNCRLKIRQEMGQGMSASKTKEALEKTLDNFNIKLQPPPKKGKSRDKDLIKSFVAGYSTGFTSQLDIQGDTICQKTKTGNWWPLVKRYQDKIALSNNHYRGEETIKNSYRQEIEEAFEKAGWITIDFNLENLKFLLDPDTKLMMLEQLIFESHKAINSYSLLLRQADYKKKIEICRVFIRQLEQERDIEIFRRMEDMLDFLKNKAFWQASLTSEKKYEALKIKERVAVILAQADNYIDILKTIQREHG